MTREEAIAMLKSKLDGHTDTSYEWCECVRMAIKALEQEPKTYNRVKNELNRVKTELEQKWISVSEGLPDIHNCCMKYLVTDCHGHIHTSLFTESGGKSRWSQEDVIAWMPLPEPYKEG